MDISPIKKGFIQKVNETVKSLNGGSQRHKLSNNFLIIEKTIFRLINQENK